MSNFDWERLHQTIYIWAKTLWIIQTCCGYVSVVPQSRGLSHQLGEFRASLLFITIQKLLFERKISKGTPVFYYHFRKFILRLISLHWCVQIFSQLLGTFWHPNSLKLLSSGWREKLSNEIAAKRHTSSLQDAMALRSANIVTLKLQLCRLSACSVTASLMNALLYIWVKPQ